MFLKRSKFHEIPVMKARKVANVMAKDSLKGNGCFS